MEENRRPPEENIGAGEVPPAGAQPQYYPPYDPRQGISGGAPGQDARGAGEVPPAGAQSQYYPSYNPRQSVSGSMPGQDTHGAGEVPPAEAQPQYYPPYDPRPQYYNVSPDPYTPDPEGMSAARTAMILGILALVVPCGGPVLGIIAILKSMTARRLGCFSGEAIAGLVCGILSLAGILLTGAYLLAGVGLMFRV